MKTIIKLLLLNIVVVVAAIFLFSPGYAGIWFGVDLMHTIASLGLIVLFAVVLIGGNLYILLPEHKTVKVTTSKDYASIADYIDKVDDYKGHKVWGKYVDQALKQIDRLSKKVNMITIILGQFFDKEEISYKSFMNVVGGIEKVFTDNLRTMINRMAIFDEDDYLSTDGTSESCREYIKTVSSMVELNNSIIDKVDKLLVEVSKLTDSNVDIANMPAILDLEELINNVQYYRD